MSDEHTRALPEDAVLAARMSAAYRDGEATAQNREPRRNPWRGGSDDAAERVLSQMWGRGYAAGNPMPEVTEADDETRAAAADDTG